MIFCSKHRIPENHDCSFELRAKSKNTSKKQRLLYEDALEFSQKDLTVAKIYDLRSEKKMTKEQAIDLLKSLIERSDDIEVRSNSIVAFQLLELKNDKVFEILENCLLSDENSNVKEVAKRVLISIFPKKSNKIWKLSKESEPKF